MKFYTRFSRFYIISENQKSKIKETKNQKIKKLKIEN